MLLRRMTGESTMFKLLDELCKIHDQQWFAFTCLDCFHMWIVRQRDTAYSPVAAMPSFDTARLVTL